MELITPATNAPVNWIFKLIIEGKTETIIWLNIGYARYPPNPRMKPVAQIPIITKNLPIFWSIIIMMSLNLFKIRKKNFTVKWIIITNE